MYAIRSYYARAAPGAGLFPGGKRPEKPLHGTVRVGLPGSIRSDGRGADLRRDLRQERRSDDEPLAECVVTVITSYSIHYTKLYEYG